MITTTLGFIAIMFMILALNEPIKQPLSYSLFLDDTIVNLRLSSLAAVCTIGALYLPRASKLEKLLPSAIASISVIITVGMAAMSLDDDFSLYLAAVTFVATGAWLAAQGEIRSRLKQVSERQDRIDKYIARKETVDESAVIEEEQTGIKMIDAELLQLSELQQKRSRRRAASGEYDLVVGDIHHKPTIVLSFIVVTIIAGVFFAWTNGDSLIAITSASMLSLIHI